MLPSKELQPISFQYLEALLQVLVDDPTLEPVIYATIVFKVYYVVNVQMPSELRRQ